MSDAPVREWRFYLDDMIGFAARRYGVSVAFLILEMRKCLICMLFAYSI